MLAFVDLYDYGEDEAYEISFAAYKLQLTEACPRHEAAAARHAPDLPLHAMRMTAGLDNGGQQWDSSSLHDHPRPPCTANPCNGSGR